MYQKMKWVADSLKQQSADMGREIDIHSEVIYGDINEGILNYARESNSDLILMATHGRSGIGRWVYGSTAERILVGASSPILLVRPSEQAQS